MYTNILTDIAYNDLYYYVYCIATAFTTNHKCVPINRLCTEHLIR